MGKVPEPKTWMEHDGLLPPPESAQSSLTIATDMPLRERLTLALRIIRSRHVSFTVSGR